MIVVIAIFWVWSSWNAAREKLQATALDQTDRIETMYRSNLDHFGTFLTQMAAIIGNEADINDLFYQAKLAVEREGGGAGGAEAHACVKRFMKDTAQLGRRCPIMAS
jgi:hypothetical protein